jgi:hypothetical protein
MKTSHLRKAAATGIDSPAAFRVLTRTEYKFAITNLEHFNSKQTAEKYLAAWALARRFTKFSDCKRDMNKLKNGKAPLELASVAIEVLPLKGSII